jgi:TonB family protein
VCGIAVISDPQPNFPANAQQRVVVGAVVVRMLLRENGQVEDIRVAGAVPQQWFREEVERVQSQWRVARLENSRSDCVVPRVLFYSYSFYYR